MRSAVRALEVDDQGRLVRVGGQDHAASVAHHLVDASVNVPAVDEFDLRRQPWVERQVLLVDGGVVTGVPELHVHAPMVTDPSLRVQS